MNVSDYFFITYRKLSLELCKGFHLSGQFVGCNFDFFDFVLGVYIADDRALTLELVEKYF